MMLLAILGAEDATQTPSKFWPEGYEMLFGVPASLIVVLPAVEVRRSDDQEGDGDTHREDPGRAGCGPG